MVTRVSDILREKGRRVLTVADHDTIGAVAKLLSDNRIGAAPVVDADGRVVGVISERDLVSGLAKQGDRLLSLPVTELMTREVRTCREEDTVVELMQVMTDHRIRHLPVIRGGTLHGLISIGDLVKQRLTEAQSELDSLRSFITS